jgi:hypothetical protein
MATATAIAIAPTVKLNFMLVLHEDFTLSRWSEFGPGFSVVMV